MEKKIFIVGSINTDFVISTPYIPMRGETLTGSNFFTAKGGKGANQAVAAAKLGGHVIMCGCVGNDVFGVDTLEALEKYGIDTSHIRICDDVSTGTAVIIVENGDNRIILDKGANACLTKDDIDYMLSEAKAGDIYLTQLENPIEIIGYGLKRAKEKGLYVILNPAPANKEILPYLEYCDLIVPNETETALLGGKEFLLTKIDTLLITLGGEGFELTTKEQNKRYPCMKIRPVDTTAAGDTLCGGLVAMLAKNEVLDKAAVFGSKAATLACKKKGAQPSIPTYAEVLHF